MNYPVIIGLLFFGGIIIAWFWQHRALLKRLWREVFPVKVIYRCTSSGDPVVTSFSMHGLGFIVTKGGKVYALKYDAAHEITVQHLCTIAMR